MSVSFRVRLFSLSTIIACSVPVFAANTTVFEEEITVTATGEEAAVPEVPVPVTVVTRQEMDDAQSESVGEMLRRVPGVTVMQSGGGGSVASVFTRGTESDHTLVLFDGVRLNSSYFGGYDWSQATTAGLDRIEVARGPYSALWGADAVGGVVNMIPGQRTEGAGGTVFLEGGEDGWRRYQGNVAYGSGAWDLFASGLRREGEQALPNSDFETTEILVDGGFSWGDGSRIALLVQDLDGETGIPLEGGVLTENRRQQSEQRLIAVPLSWRVSDYWSIKFTGSSVERDFAFSDPDDAFGFIFSENSADTLEFRLANHHRLGDHTLSWGGGWREDEVSDVSSYGVNLDDDRSDVLSFFAQDLWNVSERFCLIFGARWDDTDEWGSEISPRVNLGWKATKNLELRLGYGEAFRQPSVGELYFPFSGNPELEAETSKSAEVGFVYTSRRTRAVWQFNYFQTDLEHLIDFDYATYSFANIDKAEISGAELGLDLPWTEEVSSALSLTWLDTEDANGEELLRRPEWSGTYTISGALWEGVRGDVSLLWVDDRDDVDPVSFERTRADGFVTANLSIAWTIRGGAELTMRVINLADKEYEEVLGYPSPGRRFIGGLRFNL